MDRDAKDGEGLYGVLGREPSSSFYAAKNRSSYKTFLFEFLFLWPREERLFMFFEPSLLRQDFLFRSIEILEILPDVTVQIVSVKESDYG